MYCSEVQRLLIILCFGMLGGVLAITAKTNAYHALAERYATTLDLMLDRPQYPTLHFSNTITLLIGGTLDGTSARASDQTHSLQGPTHRPTTCHDACQSNDFGF